MHARLAKQLLNMRSVGSAWDPGVAAVKAAAEADYS